jgi:hypothetical protein
MRNSKNLYCQKCDEQPFFSLWSLYLCILGCVYSLQGPKVVLTMCWCHRFIRQDRQWCTSMTTTGAYSLYGLILSLFVHIGWELFKKSNLFQNPILISILRESIKLLLFNYFYFSQSLTEACLRVSQLCRMVGYTTVLIKYSLSLLSYLISN